MTRRKPLKPWQRLLIGADLNYAEIGTALNQANKHFQDTTGLYDTKGKCLRKPRISKGRKASLKISVNSGLKEVADILATATGKSSNKIMSILISRCLYDALRDMRLEQQKWFRAEGNSTKTLLDDDIPF